MTERYPNVAFSQFEGAEIVAEKYQITREEMESLAVASHRKADHATKSGFFKKEIVPIGKQVSHTRTRAVRLHCVSSRVSQAGEAASVFADEGIRWPADQSKMAQLKTLKPGGRITAALYSLLRVAQPLLTIAVHRRSATARLEY
jgi:acetyl-CoA C-acetyltransferase